MAGYGINPNFLNRMLNTPKYRHTPAGVPATYYIWNWAVFGFSWANPGFNWPPINRLSETNGYTPFLNHNFYSGDILDPFVHSETEPVAKGSRMNRVPMWFGASTEAGWIETARYWWLAYILDVDLGFGRIYNEQMLFATGRLKEERKLAAGEQWVIAPETFKVSFAQTLVS